MWTEHLNKCTSCGGCAAVRLRSRLLLRLLTLHQLALGILQCPFGSPGIVAHFRAACLLSGMNGTPQNSGVLDVT